MGNPNVKRNLRGNPSNSAHFPAVQRGSRAATRFLRRALPSSTSHVQVTTSDPGRLRHIRAEAYDVILLCFGSFTPAELETYNHIRRIDSCVPVIFVAGAGGADAAILAIKHGAYD